MWIYDNLVLLGSIVHIDLSDCCQFLWFCDVLNFIAEKTTTVDLLI